MVGITPQLLTTVYPSEYWDDPPSRIHIGRIFVSKLHGLRPGFLAKTPDPPDKFSVEFAEAGKRVEQFSVGGFSGWSFFKLWGEEELDIRI